MRVLPSNFFTCSSLVEEESQNSLGTLVVSIYLKHLIKTDSMTIMVRQPTPGPNGSHLRFLAIPQEENSSYSNLSIFRCKLVVSFREVMFLGGLLKIPP